MKYAMSVPSGKIIIVFKPKYSSVFRSDTRISLYGPVRSAQNALKLLAVHSPCGV